MLRKHFLIYIALFAILGGCTGGSPSEADARLVVEKDGPRWSDGIRDGTVKVMSFKKVNGQAMEIYGVKMYTMDYEVQLEFLKKDGGHKVGDKVTYTGQIEFEKTEKGWQGKSGRWKYRGS